MRNYVCLFVLALSVCCLSVDARADACADADTAIATMTTKRDSSDGARNDANNAKDYAAEIKVDAQAAWDAVKNHACITPAFTTQINSLFADHGSFTSTGNTYLSGSDSAHVAGVLSGADAIAWRSVDCITSKIFADDAITSFDQSISRANIANENYGDAANAMQQVLDDIDAYDFDCEEE